MSHEKQHIYNEQTHLDDETIAWVADCLIIDNYSSIPDEIQDHLLECAICKTSVGMLVDVMEFKVAVPSSQFIEKEADTKKRKFFSKNTLTLYMMAAVILVLISIGIVMISSNRKPLIKSQDQLALLRTERKKADLPVNRIDSFQASEKKSTVNSSNKVKSSDKFQEVPYLENMAKDNTRGNAVSVTISDQNLEKNKPLSISWDQMPNPVIFKLIDNKLITIDSVKVESNNYQIKKTLSSGLYYWFLIQEEEVIHVGKLIVR